MSERDAGTEEPGMMFGLRVPMTGVIGAIGEHLEEDYARLRMPWRADLTNSSGSFHGGALATLLDVAMCCSARSAESPERMVVTLDMALHFMSSSDRDVIAEGRCVRRGRSVAFAQGEVRSLDGELLATASSTLKLVARRKAPTHEETP